MAETEQQQSNARLGEAKLSEKISLRWKKKGNQLVFDIFFDGKYIASDEAKTDWHNSEKKKDKLKTFIEEKSADEGLTIENLSKLIDNLAKLFHGFEPQQEEHIEHPCRSCGSESQEITLNDKTTWKCVECGFEDAEPYKPETPPRDQDYSAYQYYKKDSEGNLVEVIPVSNFNVIFNRIMAIDDKERLVNVTFNYINNKGEKKKIRNVECKEIELHAQNELICLMAKYSHNLWFIRKYKQDLLDAINKDKVVQNPLIEEKTENFGWNDNFTAYLTPKWDFKLKDDIKDYYGKYVLYDTQDFAEMQGIDINDPDAQPIKGSVKILNETIQDKIKLGFGSHSEGEVKETLVHIKNTLFSLSPIVDRTIPIVFLAPLTTILRKCGMSYQMYLRGKTGNGKTQLALCYMSFYSAIDSDEALVNVARDTINAMEQIGFYHKDCLFVMDNFKETTMDKFKKDALMSLFGSVADRKGANRMPESGYKSYLIRGSPLITGEEHWSDASTIRKYDTVTILEKINMEILKQCHEWRYKYSGVTASYIQWLMRTYGTGLKDEIERRIKAQGNNFVDPPVFVLNMTGYELMLDFMLYHKTIDNNEYQSMYNQHLKILQAEEVEKKNETDNETSWNKYQNTICSLLTTGRARLDRDAECNNGFGPVIGQTSNDGTEVVIYKEAYIDIRKLGGYKLPENWKTVYSMMPDNIIDGKSVRRLDNNKPDKNTITFPREVILPHSNISMMPTMKDICGLLPDILKVEQISGTPTKEQYDKIYNSMTKFLPAIKPDQKKKFMDMVGLLTKFYLHI